MGEAALCCPGLHLASPVPWPGWGLLKPPLPLGWVPCVDVRGWGEELENPRPCGRARLQRDWLSQRSRAWLAGKVCID